MSKVPYVERDYVGGGLKGECAYIWALFLANEADMSGDVVAYDRYKSLVDELAPKPGKAIPSSVHFAALEEAIEKYDRNH